MLTSNDAADMQQSVRDKLVEHALTSSCYSIAIAHCEQQQQMLDL